MRALPPLLTRSVGGGGWHYRTSYNFCPFQRKAQQCVGKMLVRHVPRGGVFRNRPISGTNKEHATTCTYRFETGTGVVHRRVSKSPLVHQRQHVRTYMKSFTCQACARDAVLVRVNTAALVEVIGRATMDELTGSRLPDLSVLSRCGAAYWPSNPPTAAALIPAFILQQDMRHGCLVSCDTYASTVHDAVCRTSVGPAWAFCKEICIHLGCARAPACSQQTHTVLHTVIKHIV